MKEYEEKEIAYLNNLKPNVKYGDLSKEIKKWFYFEYDSEGKIAGNPPILIWALGKSFPNINYSMKRDNYSNNVIEYISDGVGYIETNGEKIKVEKGDVYILKKGSSHYYYPDKNNPYTKYWMNFSSKMFLALLDSSPLKDVVKIPGVFCEDLFIELLNIGEKSPYHDVVCFEIFDILVKIFLRLLKSFDTGFSNNIPDNIRHIKELIDHSINTNISLVEICEKLAVSHSYVITKFKEYFGITPYQYLMESKIRQATILLHNKDKTITEIALGLGFYDAYHFSKIFKKKMGVSPKQYRTTI